MATAAMSLSSPLHAAGKPGEQPNLLYVFADQLRYQSCGYAGDSRAHTPNIDRLASQGANFHNAVSTTPVCSAHRAGLLTGKYTTSTGMIINELRLSPEHECFGHVLTAGGYNTGYIGKWHLWANELGNHDDDKNAFVPPGPYRLGFDGLWAAYNFHHIYYNAYYYKDEPKKIRYGDADVYEPDAQTDMAIDFIGKSRNREDPFALFLSYGTPHDPWNWNNVPKDFIDKFRDVRFPRPDNYVDENDEYADGWAKFRPGSRKHLEQWQQGYYAMTANLDWNVGRLLEALDKAGMADNTIVVFSSDHGEMFGSHGRRAKNIFYDEAARVPFLVRWPGRIKPSGQDTCLGTPDIMPTLLSMMGLPVPEEVEGVDLSHCALGKPGGEPEAAFLQGTGATAAWSDGHEWRALRSKRYTYAVYQVDGAELLFDNKTDPGQMKNLVDDPAHADTLGRFRKMLKERMRQQNDNFKPCSWYRDHWMKDRNIMRGAKGGSHDLDKLKKIIAKHFPQPAPVKGTQLHLTFNDDTEEQARDESGKKRNMTVNGAKAVEGRKGKALEFSGDGDFLSLPDREAPNPARTPVTVSAWVKPTGRKGVILAHGGSTVGYCLHLQNGPVAFSVRIDGKVTTAVARKPLPNGWAHTAGQLDARGILNVFVNGEQVASTRSSGLLPKAPRDSIQVGADVQTNVGDYNGENYYTGLIDEVKVIYGRYRPNRIARDAAE